MAEFFVNRPNQDSSWFASLQKFALPAVATIALCGRADAQSSATAQSKKFDKPAATNSVAPEEIPRSEALWFRDQLTSSDGELLEHISSHLRKTLKEMEGSLYQNEIFGTAHLSNGSLELRTVHLRSETQLREAIILLKERKPEVVPFIANVLRQVAYKTVRFDGEKAQNNVASQKLNLDAHLLEQHREHLSAVSDRQLAGIVNRLEVIASTFKHYSEDEVDRKDPSLYATWHTHPFHPRIPEGTPPSTEDIATHIKTGIPQVIFSFGKDHQNKTQVTVHLLHREKRFILARSRLE